MSKPLDTTTTIENALKRARVAPELAKQVAQRRRKRASPDMHAVERNITPPSRLQEGAEAHSIERAPEEKNWGRASTLPAIENPPGLHCKWVRIDGAQRHDMENLARHINEGWTLARKEQFPKLALPTTAVGNYGTVLGNQKTVLCYITERQKAQRDAYFNKRRNQTTAGVATATPNQGNDRYMPMVENSVTSHQARIKPKTRAERRGVEVAVSD